MIWIDPAYRERLAACDLVSVDRILSRTDGRVSAWSRTTDTVYIASPDRSPGFYLKRYYYPRWSNRLRSALRGTLLGPDRGLAETRSLNGMLSRGVPAVRPVAYGERRVGGFVSACFLVTEEVPGAVNLTTFASDQSERPLTPPERRQLIAVLAKQVRDMHLSGFVHGQLFWRNILVRYGPLGAPEFFFLDAAPRRSLARRSFAEGVARDLACLGVSAAPFCSPRERMRFLRCYEAEADAETRRERLGQLNPICERWSRHELQRIRMNTLFENWNAALDRSQLAAQEARGA